jgi:hypothetical protein
MALLNTDLAPPEPPRSQPGFHAPRAEHAAARSIPDIGFRYNHDSDFMRVDTLFREPRTTPLLTEETRPSFTRQGQFRRPIRTRPRAS